MKVDGLFKKNFLTCFLLVIVNVRNVTILEVNELFVAY